MNEYTTPLVLTCNVTGRKQKLYHRPYIDKLIEKHGSLEKLLAEYKCKGAKPVNASEPEKAIAPAARVAAVDKIRTTTSAGKTSDGGDCVCNVYEDAQK